MQTIMTLLVASLALAWLTPTPTPALAKKRTDRRQPAATDTYGRTHNARRPASVAANGLCQRDTGTPTSDLNFRNKCDTEEFWNRMNERGGFGRW